MNDPADDPFELLGLPPAFELDAESLRRTVRRRIARLHPDRVTDPVEREHAVRMVARLNEALVILQDDERRANVLLSRLGGAAASEDRSLPPAFLMEILEIREDMEQAVASGEPAERTRVENWANSERERLRADVAKLFGRLSDGDDCASEIRLQLNVWRYIERMIEQLDPEGLDPFAGPDEF